jgi:hypothetical protein
MYHCRAAAPADAAADAAAPLPEPTDAPTTPLPSLDALDWLLRVRRSCLIPLPDITVSEGVSLQALKVQLLSLNELAAAREHALTSPDTPYVADAAHVARCRLPPSTTAKHLRVREMGLNSVPGRCDKCLALALSRSLGRSFSLLLSLSLSLSHA